MYTIELRNGGATISYLEEVDLAPCRCGGAAQYKKHTNQTYQVRCAKCSMQTAKRADNQSAMREWYKVMGGVLPDA